MRKRIAIGLAALAVIGISGYVLLQPRSGSIEYHKREVLRLGQYGKTEMWMDDHLPALLANWWQIRRLRRARFHYEALKRLEYFEERTFVLSNRSLQNVLGPRRELRPHFEADLFAFVGVVSEGTNSVTLMAPRDQMGEVERAVRKFDVPEK